MYAAARERYLELGVDTERAIAALSRIPLSMQCWQADDVVGLEPDAGAVSGGIQTTGSYPGRARTAEEIMRDADLAFSLIPGKHRLNLHASYAVTGGKAVPRDELLPEHFAPWADYARERGIGLDFNPTCFAHARVRGGLTLSSPDADTRDFWVRHARACRVIAASFAEALGGESLCNLWIPDGLKDDPADRLTPRRLLWRSLDAIFDAPLAGVVDSVESKLFGIGLEAYTTGSNEFYLAYAARHAGVYCLLDCGHFHPTESVADKISAMCCAFDRLPLHVTRPMRWDSDHVVRFDDAIRAIAQEIVRCGAVSQAMIGLDYFDASINRVAAWVIGMRATQKALLAALLTPNATLADLQRDGRCTELLALQEELKTYPLGAVWDEFCERQNVPTGMMWWQQVERYEREVLSERG